MQYNTQKQDLIIPEYGRNVHNMILMAKDIENPKERQAFVNKVVELVLIMNPQQRHNEDFRDRVWKHVFKIANYDIDVMPPNGIRPTPEDEFKKPEHVGYHHRDIKYRHYGYSVQRMIEKASTMEDGPKKDAFADVIASYMKLAYKTWNREHYVSDELIIGDLEILSNGQVVVKGTTVFDNFSAQSKSKQPSQQQQKPYYPYNRNKNRQGQQSQRFGGSGGQQQMQGGKMRKKKRK